MTSICEGYKFFRGTLNALFWELYAVTNLTHGNYTEIELDGVTDEQQHYLNLRIFCDDIHS